MARFEMNTNVRTSVLVRGKRITLKRGWLHGLWGWEVWDGTKQLGWVLERMEHRGHWGPVPMPEKDEDVYDDIYYDYDTRNSAVAGLVPKG